MIRRWSIILWWALLAVSARDAAANELLAARVNGTGILMARLEMRFEAYLDRRGIQVAAIRDPRNYKSVNRQALDILIGQELLRQAAEKDNIVEGL